MARTFIPNCNVVSVYMQRQFCCAWYKLKPNPCRDTPNHISHMTKTSHAEERAARAAAQATALEASAASLRSAGLCERAADQETEAARLRKQAAAALLPPGRRLDDLEGYCKRCRARTEAAAAALREAETARLSEP